MAYLDAYMQCQMVSLSIIDLIQLTFSATVFAEGEKPQHVRSIPTNTVFESARLRMQASVLFLHTIVADASYLLLSSAAVRPEPIIIGNDSSRTANAIRLIYWSFPPL